MTLPITRLLMLVEGQSEETFVKQTLAPFLAEHGVYVQPIVLWTKRNSDGGGFRGGVSSWDQIQKNLNPLFGDTDAWVTTLLDFYGLPDDFGGYQAAREQVDPYQQVLALQKEFAKQYPSTRFIPFFALHEFEAWLFCSPDVVAAHFGNADLALAIQQAVTHAGAPELINHGKKTHPKARLRDLKIGYKETSDGPTMMAKIGIPTIRAACPHFSAWLDRLVAIGHRDII
jgi:hypothetical protein